MNMVTECIFVCLHKLQTQTICIYNNLAVGKNTLIVAEISYTYTRKISVDLATFIKG